jgi:hypothetical protein
LKSGAAYSPTRVSRDLAIPIGMRLHSLIFHRIVPLAAAKKLRPVGMPDIP